MLCSGGGRSRGPMQRGGRTRSIRAMCGFVEAGQAEVAGNGAGGQNPINGCPRARLLSPHSLNVNFFFAFNRRRRFLRQTHTTFLSSVLKSKTMRYTSCLVVVRGVGEGGVGSPVGARRKPKPSAVHRAGLRLYHIFNAAHQLRHRRCQRRTRTTRLL